MVFEELANNILTFVNYGITVLVIMLIVEFFKFIFAGGTGTAIGSHLTDWSKSPVLNWIKKQKRQEQTKAINEYLQEGEEVKLLSGAVVAANDALKPTEKLLSVGVVGELAELDKVLDKLGKAGDALRKAQDHYRSVNKATFRQEREFGKLLNKLREEGKDVTQFTALENNILRLHKEIVSEISKVLTHYEAANGSKQFIQKTRDKIKGSAFPLTFKTGKDLLKDALTSLQTNLRDDIYLLEDAYKKQVEVEKEMQGIIAQAKQVWA